MIEDPFGLILLAKHYGRTCNNQSIYYVYADWILRVATARQ